MPNIGAPEILIVAIVVLILFGTKKMPDAARSLGRSLRIFKAETRGLREDEAREVRPRPLAGPRTDPPAAESRPSDQVLIDGRPLDPPPAADERRDGR